jgi:hypothetical protein
MRLSRRAQPMRAGARSSAGTPAWCARPAIGRQDPVPFPGVRIHRHPGHRALPRIYARMQCAEEREGVRMRVSARRSSIARGESGVLARANTDEVEAHERVWARRLAAMAPPPSPEWPGDLGAHHRKMQRIHSIQINRIARSGLAATARAGPA